MKFQEMAPKWYEAVRILRNYGYPKYNKYCIDNGLHMGSHEKCIVGEAHGFSDSFLKGCDTCTEYSLDFALDLLARPAQFEVHLKEFEDHFCEKHAKSKS